MSDCNHDCSHCASNCGERTEKQSFIEKPHELTHIKKIIGVVSGKGGVGKSFVTVNLAVMLQNKGYQCAILDADITGPSIPKSFGITQKATGTDEYIIPVTTPSGMQIMSINLILEDDTAPVVWRGPVIAGAVTQFWTDVLWRDVDYMFVDMPPGTGDVPLTVFQSLPVDGIIVVTTPQDLVGMIVSKAVRMAEMMNIPVLGVVENMSYYTCPDCRKQHEIFGASKVQAVAAAFDIPHTARIPVDPVITAMVDAGEVEHVNADFLAELVDSLEKDLPLDEEA